MGANRNGVITSSQQQQQSGVYSQQSGGGIFSSQGSYPVGNQQTVYSSQTPPVPPQQVVYSTQTPFGFYNQSPNNRYHHHGYDDVNPSCCSIV